MICKLTLPVEAWLDPARYTRPVRQCRRKRGLARRLLCNEFLDSTVMGNRAIQDPATTSRFKSIEGNDAGG